MQCDNCGYIFFQPSKKCACCMAPYTPTTSAFDIGQENLFTIFEMAPGEGGTATSLQVNEAGVGLEDYNFTDDYDSGGGYADHGADDNTLDLSDAESEGYETGYASESPGADDFDTGRIGGLTSYSDDIGPNDFELDLSEALAEQVLASNAPPPMEVAEPAMEEAAMPDIAPEPAAPEPELEPEPEAELSVDISAEGDSSETAEADAARDTDFGGGGFDSEVEGLGFGFDESPTDTPPEPEAELELSAEEPESALVDEPSLEAGEEPEIALVDEPSLEAGEEPETALVDEPSLEVAEEPEIVMDDGPSLELDEDAEFDAVVVDPSEVEEDTGEIEFDLDSVDLDAPEPALDEKPQAELPAGDTEVELEGLEMEMESPEEPEEDLEK